MGRVQSLQLIRGAPEVRKGDRVVVNLDQEVVEYVQLNHGGWVDLMKYYLGKKGKVHKVDSDGDVVIKYNDGVKFVYNPDVVAKILSRGDTVQITVNLEKAIFLQKEHGGWVSSMENILGKYATVLTIHPNYDVVVGIGGDIWRLNPLLCTVIKKSSNDTSSDDDDISGIDMFMKMFSISEKAALFTLAGEQMKSSLMDELSLHTSVYQEDENKIKSLLQAGIDINKTDTNGNTALHFAVLTKNQKITRLLVEKGANLNILNKKEIAPIHFAVWGSSIECVKELKNCDINIKNGGGDTPLILATMKKEYDILDHILTYQNVDLTCKNKNGFSALHLAAKIGDVKVLEKLLEKRSDIVDMQKIDGYTALHLSTLNDNFEATKFLIQKAKAKLDIRTITQGTPLLLAAEQKHFDIVRLLVSEGADINAQDSDGNTSLHLAINKEKRIGTFLEMLVQSSDKSSDGEKIAIYLVENGASILIENKDGKIALDMITNDTLKAELQKKAESRNTAQKQMSCLMCSETKKLVKFQPCGHMKLCVDCNKVNIQAKKCMECKREITERIEPGTKENNPVLAFKRLFEPGDRVCISMDEDLFMKQEGKENPNRKSLFNKIGTVKNVGEGAKINVQFEEKEYKILPEMLTKVFIIGDKVKVLKNLQLVKDLQKGHAEWTEEMNEIIGKIGKVVKIEKTKVTVEIDTKSYSLNPLACIWNNEAM